MSTSSTAAAIGRVLMSVIFVLSGFEKLSSFGGTAGYMATYGLPMPELAAVVAIVIECIGGLLVLVGYQTRLAALVLAVWSVATALVAHTNFGDANQMVHFLKNLAICGGFLQLAAYGAGRWSLDARAASTTLHA